MSALFRESYSCASQKIDLNQEKEPGSAKCMLLVLSPNNALKGKISYGCIFKGFYYSESVT